MYLMSINLMDSNISFMVLKTFILFILFFRQLQEVKQVID
jgi:hypothetical protein